LFGLTSAEKDLATQAAHIALSRLVSVHTVRSQIDAIYDKAGQSSQLGLQKLILDLTPPLLQEPD
jgi:hypothetical protein